MLVVCLFSLWRRFYFFMQWVLALSTTSGFIYFSLIPSFTILSVVATNGFLEDMILVLYIFYLVCFKTKVILSVNFNSFIAFPHNILLSAMKVQLFKYFSLNIVVSHKPD